MKYLKRGDYFTAIIASTIILTVSIVLLAGCSYKDKNPQSQISEETQTSSISGKVICKTYMAGDPEIYTISVEIYSYSFKAKIDLVEYVSQSTYDNLNVGDAVTVPACAITQS